MSKHISEEIEKNVFEKAKSLYVSLLVDKMHDMIKVGIIIPGEVKKVYKQYTWDNTSYEK